MRPPVLIAASLLLAPFVAAAPAHAAPPAPGGPGTLSHFGLARKDCVGTATGRESKVWYTVADGVLSDVYSPTVDTTNVESMRFVVTDGATFTDVQTRDTTYTVRALDDSGMSCEVTSTARSGKYRIVARYLTDPRRDAVVAQVRLVTDTPGLQLWVHLDPSVNGNGGGGPANGGADDATVDAETGALVAADPQTVSNAVNRDYAVPNALGLRADRPFLAANSGFAGTASDGLAQLDASRRLTAAYPDAFGGNVVQTARLDTRGGPANGGADDATVDAETGALVAADPQTVSNAVNRDYAVPNALALRADRPFLAANSGFAGTASDGLAQLDASRRLTAAYPDAFGGNVVQTARLDTRGGPVTLALGFGRDAGAAVDVAGEAVRTPFALTAARYHAGWAAYDRTLRRPPAAYRRAWYLSANVLKASEDKTFPGAIVASLASPWGQAVSAGDTPGGRPVYFGSYREVFARDLYESFTGLLATGDLATARSTVRFLFERQQLADGRFPRNSLLNGKAAPDTGGDQLDESAYPILMAWQAGLAGDRRLWPRVKRAADFVVAHGPAYGSERWEEQSGHSPSTIAAEIAGLVAAAFIAEKQGDRDAARVYRATADHFQRSIKGWTVTTTGPYAPRYFIRLAKTGDPDAAITYNLGNGGPDADQRSVVDAGFLELTRLGILPADDPDVLASLPVVDRVIRVGDRFYRYGTATPGTEDGYGDCWEPDPTACAPSGRPWPTGNAGSGHVWPVLSGERAEQQLQTGDRRGAVALLETMIASGSGVGLVPEQSWENPAVPRSAYGTAPEQASIGFEPGQAAGSASPLTWAQAQQVRLIRSVAEGRPVEQPSIVRARYVDRGAPGSLPVTVTGPADGSVVPGGTAVVTGTTAPRARVTVAGTPTDVAGATRTVTVTADGDGAFRATVPVGFLANVVTVAAERGRATGYARLTVVSEALPGRAVLDVTDPTGDDHGPGTYRYPTAADFRPGAYDLQRFQVIDGGDTVYLRAQLRDLTPTFGSALGAQLLDVFVRDPAADRFSTEAPFPERNYTIAADSAWSSRIEVQGFAGPVFVDAGGDALGTVSVTANQATRSILVGVPKAALGTPGPGWVFTVALHGQDGFSGDQARNFAATPQPYQFGLCAAGDPAAICRIDPATAPKVLDTIVPAGTSQEAVLDPTAGPVALRGVAVP